MASVAAMLAANILGVLAYLVVGLGESLRASLLPAVALSVGLIVPSTGVALTLGAATALVPSSAARNAMLVLFATVGGVLVGLWSTRHSPHVNAGAACGASGFSYAVMAAELLLFTRRRAAG